MTDEIYERVGTPEVVHRTLNVSLPLLRKQVVNMARLGYDYEWLQSLPEWQRESLEGIYCLLEAMEDSLIEFGSVTIHANKESNAEISD